MFTPSVVSRRLSATILSLIIISMSLSGCISLDEKNQDDGINIAPEDELPYFEKEGYRCIVHDDYDRCWLTYVPEQVNESNLVPLIIDLHGWSLSAYEQRNISGFMELSDEVGAILLNPEGLAFDGEPLTGGSEESWNAGWCCADAVIHNVDDLGFLDKLIDLAIQIHPVDPARVYVTGWSNGCGMSYYLSFHSSEKIAAMACMAMYLLGDIPSNYTPIPMMEIHGMLDDNVWYAWGARPIIFNPDSWFDNSAYETGAIENMYEVADFNGCSGSLPDTNIPKALYSIQAFTDCDNGAEVQLVSLYAGTHNPYEKDYGEPSSFPRYVPGNGGLIPTTQIAWDFMSQFSKEISDEDNEPLDNASNW